MMLQINVSAPYLKYFGNVKWLSKGYRILIQSARNECWFGYGNGQQYQIDSIIYSVNDNRRK